MSTSRIGLVLVRGQGETLKPGDLLMHADTNAVYRVEEIEWKVWTS